MRQQVARVLRILQLLQANGRMSGAELAQRLEVDVRTVRRYVALLEDIGIHVTAERGRHGAYALGARFKLPPLMFSADEALAVSVGLVAVRSLGLAQAVPAVASAQAKMERVMPAHLKGQVRAVDETLTLDLAGSQSLSDNKALVVLSTAAQTHQRVHLHYRAASGRLTRRDFDCYGLAWRAGWWYAAGHCHLRNDLRLFRLDRIKSVCSLNVTFSRPSEFNISRHLTFSVANIARETPIEVLLHTNLMNAIEALGETVGLFEPCGKDVLLRSQTNSVCWYARQLARLPFDFEIRRPAELRDAVRRRAERLLRLAAHTV